MTALPADRPVIPARPCTHPGLWAVRLTWDREPIVIEACSRADAVWCRDFHTGKGWPWLPELVRRDDEDGPWRPAEEGS